MGVVPKLRLGNRVVVPGKDKNGNPKMAIKSTGAHTVKFVEEPKIIMGKSFEGEARQEFQFIVEENGQKYRWHVPLFNREKQPNYLLERTAEINVGDVRILEMMARGAAKYIDIRKEGEAAAIPDEDDLEHDDGYEDEEGKALADALKKEGQ